MHPISPERIPPRAQTKVTFSESNGQTTRLEGIVQWIFRVLLSVGILEVFGISKAASFQECKSQLFSYLFDVNHATIPWGLYLCGEGVKLLNAWTRRSDGTINRRFADLIELKVPASEKPRNGVCSKDIIIDEETNVWVRIYTPTQKSVRPHSQHQHFTESELRPVLVYYHGGGFGVLCPDQMDIDNLCRTMAKTSNIVIISANYRRAPEHRYPAAYQDSFKVLQWLESADSNAYLPPMADISQCFLAGDSAGGNIAHFMACQAAENEKALLPLRVRGVILLQPFFGGEQRTAAEITLANVPFICTDATDWHWKAFLPEGADRNHPACNVVGPGAPDLSELSLPPILLVTGTLDLLIDHHIKYTTRMREMGKSIKVKNYNGGVHGFYFFEPVGTKIASACFADVKEFIQSCSPVNMCKIGK